MRQMTSALSVLALHSSSATALGVAIAAFQLHQAKNQSASAFEDQIAREYRQIAARLPIGALLGESLTDYGHQKALDEFYHYFDLSNEQIFLRQNQRVSNKTWKQWVTGIRSNLERPAFKRAWKEIKDRSNGDFDELRRLEKSDYQADPRKWRKMKPSRSGRESV
jgi:hypothetical protein